MIIETKIIEKIEKYIEKTNEKNKNCDWQITKNGDGTKVIIIGEDHTIAEVVNSEEWKLQRFIFGEIKRMYIVSERLEKQIEQQMQDLKIEDVRFCESIGSDEKKQGKRIKECLEDISEIPVIALIGHTHAGEKYAGEKSELHEYLKSNNIKYICIWNTKKVKTKDVRDKEKEEERTSEKFGFGKWT